MDTMTADLYGSHVANNVLDDELSGRFYSAEEFRKAAKNDLNNIFKKYGRI